MATIERRAACYAVRAAPDTDEIELAGVAMRFDDREHPARIAPDLWEVFAVGSLREAARGVTLNLNHEAGRPLARTPKTMRVEFGEREATFRAFPPLTRDAEDARALIAAGVLDGVSIEFRALAEEESSLPDGRPLRIVTKAELSGIALLTNPAYAGTSVDARDDAWSARRKVRRWL